MKVICSMYDATTYEPHSCVTLSDDDIASIRQCYKAAMTIRDRVAAIIRFDWQPYAYHRSPPMHRCRAALSKEWQHASSSTEMLPLANDLIISNVYRGERSELVLGGGRAGDLFSIGVRYDNNYDLSTMPYSINRLLAAQQGRIWNGENYLQAEEPREVTSRRCVIFDGG